LEAKLKKCDQENFEANLKKSDREKKKASLVNEMWLLLTVHINTDQVIYCIQSRKVFPAWPLTLILARFLGALAADCWWWLHRFLT
jgi:hypothetical protein